MIILPLLVLASVIEAMPHEYVVEFKNAGENAAAYKLTVTVVATTGTKADVFFPVKANITAGLLRDSVYGVLKDCKGIEVEPDGDDRLRVKAAQNEKLLWVRFNGSALQQHTSLRGYPVGEGGITLELKMKGDVK